MNSTRKLSAIVFADIAGYTALMQKNEEQALQVLNHFRNDIEEIVPNHQGEIIQFYGDGCLLIFNSALDAVTCSENLQKSFVIQPEVPVRIGIHQGDIILEGGNIFGDNVNIAARIESISIPGSILMSSKVRSELINQPSIILRSLGTFNFKNVENSIEVFALTGEELVIPNRNEIDGKLKTKSIDKSIAVLAFKNHSGEKDQEYFGEGIAEEILYGLSQIEDLKVAGRTSSFSFKELPDSIKEIGAQLNVGHILQGSVRKSGNRIRVNVQLINVSDGFQIWTERFDRELKDIFAIQDEIADQVVQKLKLSLLGSEKFQSFIRRKTENIEAYELYLKGRSLLDKRQNIAEALNCFKAAIELDSKFAEAYTSIAYGYFYMVVFENMAPHDGFPLVSMAIKKALSIDNSIAEAHTMKGLVEFYYNHETEKARLEYDTAVMLQNNLADTYRVKAYFHVMIKEFEKAYQCIEKSFEIDPLSFNICFSKGDINTRTGRFSDAIEIFESLLMKHPNSDIVKPILAINYYLNNEIDKSDQLISRIDLENLNLNLYNNDIYVIQALKGNIDLTQKHLNYLLESRKNKWISPANIAILYYALGEQSRGNEYLSLANEENDPVLHMIEVLPLWKEYLKYPFVKNLLKSRKGN